MDSLTGLPAFIFDKISETLSTESDATTAAPSLPSPLPSVSNKRAAPGATVVVMLVPDPTPEICMCRGLESLLIAAIVTFAVVLPAFTNANVVRMFRALVPAACPAGRGAFPSTISGR